MGICYDLIPFLRPEAYLTSARCRSWYYRRLLQMRHMAGLLAISESSRGEAVGRLGFPPEDVTNILAGVGAQFRPERDGHKAEAALLARYGLQQPGFILCIGAVEPRKNLDGLIRAYALLPAALRQKHRLVATGWNDTSQLRRLHALAAASGLTEGEIALLTDFVPEQDLPRLYRASVLSISPSLHEGFGLAAAEAMACGVPVIGSNTTSLPEVIGRADALFDPADPADIAARLTQVLTDPALRDELGRYGLARSTMFTWPETARRAWAALETIKARATGARPRGALQSRPGVGARKPRMAILMPLSAGHAAPTALLTELARFYEIDIVSEDPMPDDAWMQGNFPVVTPAHLVEAAYDRLLYIPGDDARHSMLTLNLLAAYPGVVALGRRPLAALLCEALGGEMAALLRSILIELHGWYAALAVHRDPAKAARYSAEPAFAARAIGLLAPYESAPADDSGAQTSGGQMPERLAGIERVGPEDALDWRDGIERQYRSGQNVAFDRCMSALVPGAIPPGDLPAAAAALAASFRPTGRPGLYLDVSTIVGHDAGTGIQRVVRETVRQLGLMEDLPCRIEPVRDTGQALYLARGFGARLFGLPEPDGSERLAEIGEGDVFLGLDLNIHDLPGLLRTLRWVRQNGGRAVVVVYDLLPMQMPACFPEPVQKLFPVWLDTITRHADGLLCISRTVADDLLALLDSCPPARRTPLSVGWFHLGSDFVPCDRHPALSRAENQVRQSTELRPSLLMVGTVEPRKGHALAFEALQSLWAADVDIGLTIVGKAGWLMESLVEQFRSHPEAGRRLNWIEQASDSLVAELYRSAGALLMASEGEGFGLPIVEAAQAGLAVIARDIPIFREIAGEHALYFPPGGPDALADTIRRWLDLRKDGRVPDPTQIRAQSWAEASSQLAHVVIEGHWYATWTPGRESPGQAELHELHADAGIATVTRSGGRLGFRRTWQNEASSEPASPSSLPGRANLSSATGTRECGRAVPSIRRKY